MTDHPIRTEMVEANGLTFEVDMCGGGDKFALCLHGFPEHSFSWRYQLPLLASLGYTVWAPNQRGYGKSSRPKGVENYAIEHLLADAAGLIDASGFKDITLIGHDWGAVVSWAFAIQQVRPLTRLVIMNVPHPAPFIETIQNSKEQRRKSWYIRFFQIPWLPEFLLGLGNAKRVGAAFSGMARDKTNFGPDVIQVYRDNAAQPGALTAMINWYRANFSDKGGLSSMVDGQVPVIETPTLMLWGEADDALGKETTLGTEQYVQDFTIRYLPGVSHWVQQEAPEAVNAALEAWLTGQPIPEKAPDGRALNPS
ncbi:MAG: alpha/beta fold hydrolase [Alphaproteobacteria bacterium]